MLCSLQGTDELCAQTIVNLDLHPATTVEASGPGSGVKTRGFELIGFVSPIF